MRAADEYLRFARKAHARCDEKNNKCCIARALQKGESPGRDVVLISIGQLSPTRSVSRYLNVPIRAAVRTERGMYILVITNIDVRVMMYDVTAVAVDHPPPPLRTCMCVRICGYNQIVNAQSPAVEGMKIIILINITSIRMKKKIIPIIHIPPNRHANFRVCTHQDSERSIYV